jgi:hypothetical protein
MGKGQDFTWCSWVNTTVLNTQGLLGAGGYESADPENRGMFAYPNSTGFFFGGLFKEGGGYEPYGGNETVIVANEWYYMCQRWTSSTLTSQWFIAGEGDPDMNITSEHTFSGDFGDGLYNLLHIACENDAYGEGHDPGMYVFDETTFWNVSLSDDSVQSLYDNSGTPEMNAAPYLESDVIITNGTLANNDTDLNCTFTPLDDNGEDTLTAYVKWYEDGILEVENEMPVNHGSESMFSLYNGNTTAGDKWYCSVRIYDGSNSSDWNTSTTTLIVPGIENKQVTISPEPTAELKEDLHCSFTPLGEGVSLTANVSWYKDNEYQFSNEMPVTNATESTFVLDGWNVVESVGNTTEEGKTWYCSIQIIEGSTYSPWFNSSSETFIHNSDTTNGNHTITHDVIVGSTEGIFYLYSKAYSSFVQGAKYLMQYMKLMGTDLVAAVIGKNNGGTPQLSSVVMNETSENSAGLRMYGDNALLVLSENTTAVPCNSDLDGGIIYSAGKLYRCDGSNWNAL